MKLKEQLKQLRIKLQIVALKIEQKDTPSQVEVIELENLARDLRILYQQQEKKHV